MLRKDEIDSVLIIYSGHGSSNNNIILPDGKEYQLFRFYQKFDNNNIKLINIPKFFIMDCCRGDNIDKNIKDENEKLRSLYANFLKN